LTLKNITLERARFIGGSALVWAHGNPRHPQPLGVAPGP
jgi:hypothetical protein